MRSLSRKRRPEGTRQCCISSLDCRTAAQSLFFESPEQPFEFVDQHDFDLHLALKVPEAKLTPMLDLAARRGIERRGISDHGFIHSVYFRDPNGYVVELAADIEAATELDSKNDPHEVLANWGRN